MRRELTAGQIGLMRGPVTMAAPRRYPLELRERVVGMYCATEPKPFLMVCEMTGDFVEQFWPGDVALFWPKG